MDFLTFTAAAAQILELILLAVHMEMAKLKHATTLNRKLDQLEMQMREDPKARCAEPDEFLAHLLNRSDAVA